MANRIVFALGLVALVAACAPSDTAVESGAKTSSTSNEPTPISLEEIADIDGAIAVNIASNEDDPPVVSWIGGDAVHMASVNVESEELADTLSVNGDYTPIAHPIERPGLAVRADGTVDIAFTSQVGDGGSVIYTNISDEEALEPMAISGDPLPETNLVHIATDDNRTALAWLENSTLSVGTPTDPNAAPVETALADDLTCDCCNPAPVFIGDELVVPFRDYQIVNGEVVRDTASVRSVDGGATFEPTAPIADDHWFLDACPFSGPSAVRVGDTLVVAFMDGRQSEHPEGTSSSIWVDVSHDRGATFGSDLEIAGEGINRWPVMAVDDRDRIHLIWEVAGSEGGLSYASSDDMGTTFTEPLQLISTEEVGQSPRAPSVTHHDGRLLITWTDSFGGHVGVLDLG